MKSLKQFLQEWLGVEQLGLYVELTREELGLTKGIAVTTVDDTVELANKLKGTTTTSYKGIPIEVDESMPDGLLVMGHFEDAPIKKGYES